jgi:hypothetical protein
MLRTALLASVALATLFASRSSWAEEGPTGVELGVRAGYAIPFGDDVGAQAGSNADTSLGDLLTGVVPIWLDAGYRITPHVYVGGFFQYGFSIINNDKTQCGTPGASCSSNDLMFGANAHYHFMPTEPFDLWVGLGVGYEILNTSSSLTLNGAKLSSDASFNGFQFVNAQVGGDLRVAPTAALGPFAMVSVNQYSNCSATLNGQSGDCKIQNTAIHEFVTFGLRGVFDIPVR